MKPSMKMALMSAANLPPYSEMDMESKFRDRRGRKHYDNGKFAPKGEYGVQDYGDMNYARGVAPSQYNGPSQYDDPSQHYRHEEHGRPMGRIGFVYGNEMEQTYRTDAGYPSMNEGEYRSGTMEHGHAKGTAAPKFNRELAERWVKAMEHANGGKGPKWSLDQVKQALAKKGVTSDPVQMWVAMNALYSDYCDVFLKNGLGENVDLYIEMAKAFIEDSDAHPDKLARYYEYIVKH